MESRYLGEEVKVRIKVTEESGLALDEFRRWHIEAWTRSSRKAIIESDECGRDDNDPNTIICAIDTNRVGSGILKIGLVAEINDSLCSGGSRTTIAYTEVMNILKKYVGNECA